MGSLETRKKQWLTFIENEGKVADAYEDVDEIVYNTGEGV